MTFSWEQFFIKAKEMKIERNKIMAKTQHPDHKLKYPDECRDANNNDFTKLSARVKKEVETQQKVAMDRRVRLLTRE